MRLKFLVIVWILISSNAYSDENISLPRHFKNDHDLFEFIAAENELMDGVGGHNSEIVLKLASDSNVDYQIFSETKRLGAIITPNC